MCTTALSRMPISHVLFLPLVTGSHLGHQIPSPHSHCLCSSNPYFTERWPQDEVVLAIREVEEKTVLSAVSEKVEGFHLREEKKKPDDVPVRMNLVKL